LKIDWSNPRSKRKITRHIRIVDVTQGDSRRVPKTANVERNILKVSKYLDSLIDAWGPLEVTSFYRPADVNASIGGARNSQHIQGLAADVVLQGPKSRRERFQDWLEKHHGGGVGSTRDASYTHIDLGPKRRWTY